MRALASLLALTSLVATAHAEESIDYTVKPGDTCIGVAIGILGDRRQVAAIHRLNPSLGRTPHALTPGQVLRLPAKAKREADATVTRMHNQVEVRRAGDDLWSPAIVGNELFRAWRVGSRQRSSARVVFTDTSAIEMRENTVVVIYGSTAASSQPRRATLETGALRTRLGELDGKRRGLDVETPAATVAVAPGSAVVEVDARGTTLVSNHQGDSARLRGKAGGATRVDAGFGADAARGKRPSAARPLPPSPAWGIVPGLAIGWRATGASLRATWNTVAVATSYRLELAADTGVDTPILQLVVPATTTAIELHGIPAGSYRLAIASIDAAGLEGVPHQTPPIRGALLGISGDPVRGAASQAAPGDAAPPRVIALGALLEVPPGLDCDAEGRSVVATSGATTIRCHVGPASAALVAAVDPITLQPVGAAGRGARVIVAEGDVAIATISLVSPTPLGAGQIIARSEAKVRVAGATRMAASAQLSLVGLAPGRARVELALLTPGGEVALGAIDVEVTARAVTPVAPLVRRPRHEPRLWAAVAGGITSQGGYALGAASLEQGLTSLLAIDAGVRLAVDDHQTVDAGILLRAAGGAVTPMLRAGGVVSFAGDLGVRVGLAARATLTTRLSAYLRVDGIGITDSITVDALAGLAVHLD